MFSITAALNVIRGYRITNYRIGRRNKPLMYSPEAIHATLASLRNAMAYDKLFLDPALGLTQLSNHIHISPETVTAVLHQHFEKSFDEFVNEYRVEEFKRKIFGHHPFDIIRVAMQCGFNSQADFHRAFKYFTGMSPAEYLWQRSVSKKSA